MITHYKIMSYDLLLSMFIIQVLPLKTILNLPDYRNLILFDKSWPCLGLFTSLSVHQADQGLDCYLRGKVSNKYVHGVILILPPLPSPVDASYIRTRHTRLT